MIDHDELRALCEAAKDCAEEYDVTVRGDDVATQSGSATVIFDFMRAAHPATVLALLDEIDRMERIADSLVSMGKKTSYWGERAELRAYRKTTVR